MKTLPILLLAAATVMLSALPASAQAADKAGPRVEALPGAALAPKFEAFVARLQSCKGLVRALAQWTQVVKPALQDMGYTTAQIQSTKSALAAGSLPLEVAALFSEKWLQKHGETIAPADLQQMLARSRKP